jgi:hypothetical protein
MQTATGIQIADSHRDGDRDGNMYSNGDTGHGWNGDGNGNNGNGVGSGDSHSDGNREGENNVVSTLWEDQNGV